MGERPRTKPNQPTWALDVTTGYPHVLRGVDTHLHGGFSARDSGIGSGAGRIHSWRSRNGGWRYFGSGGNQSPQWYRWLAAGASGTSVLVILIILFLVTR